MTSTENRCAEYKYIVGLIQNENRAVKRFITIQSNKVTLAFQSAIAYIRNAA